MDLSDGLTLAGLSLGTIGAVLLAYDVVYGPGKRWQASIIKGKLEQLQGFRKLIRSRTEALPRPPYTEQDIQKLLEEQDAKWGPEEAALKQQNEIFLDRYESRVVNLGAVGVILIVLSFAVQIGGVLVGHNTGEAVQSPLPHQSAPESGPGAQIH